MTTLTVLQAHVVYPRHVCDITDSSTERLWQQIWPALSKMSSNNIDNYPVTKNKQ